MKVMQSTDLKTPCDSLYSEGIEVRRLRQGVGRVEGRGGAQAECQWHGGRIRPWVWSSCNLGSTHRCWGRGLESRGMSLLTPAGACVYMCVHAIEWNERCTKECECTVLSLVHPNSVRLFSTL